jgi:uncharacterized membrane protein
MSTPAVRQREERQLRRLIVFMDVVYAVCVLRIFLVLPRPDAEQWKTLSFGDFLAEHQGVLVMALIAVVLVIVYWLQNNAFFGNLSRTNGVHTALSILQVFFVLLSLYAIRVGIDFGKDATVVALESLVLALVGVASLAGWTYAMKNRRLLSDEITDEEAEELRFGNLAEPVAALLTLPVAIFAPAFWGPTWLLYFPVAWFLKWRRKRGAD